MHNNVGIYCVLQKYMRKYNKCTKMNNNKSQMKICQVYVESECIILCIVYNDVNDNKRGFERAHIKYNKRFGI